MATFDERFALPTELPELADNRLFNDYQVSPGTSIGNKLFGTGGEERFQTWPERMIRSGLALPADVYSGREPIVDDSGHTAQPVIERAMDTAGLAGMSTLGIKPGSASVGSGMVRKSPEFENWFGNSKVVNEKGEPLVVYHGSKSDFNSFDIKKHGASDEGLAGKGFYFTYNPEEASNYALNETWGKGSNPNVKPAYVALENPLIIKQGVLPDGRTIKDVHGGIGINSKGGEAIKKLAEESGHDGVIFANSEGMPRHVVAYKPEQIKSSTGNSGAFNASNPNMLLEDSKAATAIGSDGKERKLVPVPHNPFKMTPIDYNPFETTP